MNLTTLRQFRHDIYDCCLRAKDALFTTMDALITQTQARSLPELPQAPCFERHWSSVYEAFEDGSIDRKRLQAVFARYLPVPQDGARLWISIDASSIARPAARTSADRTAQPVHNLPKSKQAIIYGWQFSTVVALPEPASSWTYVLDQRRITSSTTALELAFTQLQELAPQLPAQTVVALDRGYDSAWLWCRCSTLSVGVLARVKRNRRFYRPASPQQVRRGLTKLLPRLGTPARPPKPRGKAKGRIKGTKVRKATRLGIVCKTSKVPQLVPS
ncbi:MAG: transposase [Ktedonobacteraceae bacterium]|nr:transposase [Ktedonobacteraceae bacterium]